MATSSITKSFVISGKEQVEKFVNAIEEMALEKSRVLFNSCWFKNIIN